MRGISPETVRLHFLRIGDVKALDWILHVLTDDLKRTRGDLCQIMLAALPVQEQNQRHHIFAATRVGFILNTLGMAYESLPSESSLRSVSVKLSRS
jgi:hypothetical protein